jgi:hypothetical protein
VPHSSNGSGETSQNPDRTTRLSHKSLQLGIRLILANVFSRRIVLGPNKWPKLITQICAERVSYPAGVSVTRHIKLQNLAVLTILIVTFHPRHRLQKIWITGNNKSQQVFLPFDRDIFVYFRTWLRLIEECIWNVLTVEDW